MGIHKKGFEIMLPPHELKNKSFTRAMRGYNPVEVDEYIEFLIEKYTEIYRENDELERKLKSAVIKLEELKNDEDSIRSALIDAKRAASQIRTEAEERAEAIIRSAKVSCNTILSDFNEKIEEGRDTLISLKLDTLELKHELFDRYSEHIRYIDRLTDGIDMSDIPDSDTLRRKAVNSLKSNIAEIYAPSGETKQSAETPINKPNNNIKIINEYPQDSHEPNPVDLDESDTTEFRLNEAAGVSVAESRNSDNSDDTIEFTPATDDSIASAVENIFDAIPGRTASETVSNDEPSLVVNREPLSTKPVKSGLKSSIRELNQRYKDSEDIINTPDSDLEEDTNYLDFVKTVTGKEAVTEPAKDADFDLLFNESKNKKKKR